jgi:hypothetical protein
MNHLDSHGRALDLKALAGLLASSADASPDVSTVVANRRRALRFKQFLVDITTTAPADQSFLVIASSQHLRYSASDLANWLQSRVGSRLVVLPNAEVWLDQMRGWLVLMSLDSRLGTACQGTDELMVALRDHLASDSDGEPARASPHAVQPSGDRDERGDDASRQALHAVGG